MDIPAFVGFAASGPFDVPVAVEDTVHFHDVFGRWGSATRLGHSTRRDGVCAETRPGSAGIFSQRRTRRCWIVRVADNTSAISNGFLVPGLLQTQADGSYAAASLVARSEGSWSDGSDGECDDHRGSPRHGQRNHSARQPKRQLCNYASTRCALPIRHRRHAATHLFWRSGQSTGGDGCSAISPDRRSRNPVLEPKCGKSTNPGGETTDATVCAERAKRFLVSTFGCAGVSGFHTRFSGAGLRHRVYDTSNRGHLAHATRRTSHCRFWDGASPTTQNGFVLETPRDQ